MKKHFVWTLFILSFLVLKTQAQTDSTYFKLVERVRAGDTTVNFETLRLSYAKTDLYSPYGSDNNIDSASKAMKEERYNDALQWVESEFKTNYPTLDGHYIALIANKRLGDTVKTNFHRWVYRSLVKSIYDSGEGTLESPFIVINTGEEYNIIRDQLGYRFEGQSLQNHNGHSYDVMKATDPKTGKEYTFYFQVDLLFESMNKMFKEDE